MRRIIAALNPPRRIHDFIAHASFISGCLARGAIFAPLAHLLPDLDADVAELEAAQVGATLRGCGKVAARDARRTTVQFRLNSLRSGVQAVAEANPADAATIIVSAGMSVKKVAGPSKPPFAVKPGRVSTTAHAYARAAKTRASYEWQWSLDGVTWVDAPPTVRADAELRGLFAGRLHFFRYRFLSRAGVSDWSDVVSLIVA